LDDVAFEYSHKCMEAFKLFIQKVGYNIGDDIDSTGMSVEKRHEVELDDTYAWDTIPDIEGDARRIETKVKARNATNIEKISYKKTKARL
jgi:hypothetical protein